RQHISYDLKERIPYLQYTEGLKVKEMERLLGIRKSLVYQTLKYYRNYGTVYNPLAYTHFPYGQCRILDGTDIKLIKALLGQNPCLYLDELQSELTACRGISISVPTLLRTLRCLHFTQKSVS
ncbi:hypothetical protein BD779DRAFT_1423736, partial [Infundibulicybe gibba]